VEVPAQLHCCPQDLYCLLQCWKQLHLQLGLHLYPLLLLLVVLVKLSCGLVCCCGLSCSSTTSSC
jgi:hypothetical protein